MMMMMISIRFRYIDHLVANRMAASMCGCGVGMGIEIPSPRQR